MSCYKHAAFSELRIVNLHIFVPGPIPNSPRIPSMTMGLEGTPHPRQAIRGGEGSTRGWCILNSGDMRYPRL